MDMTKTMKNSVAAKDIMIKTNKSWLCHVCNI